MCSGTSARPSSVPERRLPASPSVTRGRRCVIVVSAGNSGRAEQHVEFSQDDLNNNRITVPFQVDDVDPGSPLETALDFWFDRRVRCSVTVTAPDGTEYGVVRPGAGAIYAHAGGILSICNDVSSPANGDGNIPIILKSALEGGRQCNIFSVNSRLWCSGSRCSPVKVFSFSS